MASVFPAFQLNTSSNSDTFTISIFRQKVLYMSPKHFRVMHMGKICIDNLKSRYACNRVVNTFALQSLTESGTFVDSETLSERYQIHQK